MSYTTDARRPALAYPLSESIHVYRDEGWRDFPVWFLRPMAELESLYVATYGLPVDDLGDVAISATEWAEMAAELVANHPGCVFIYASMETGGRLI